MRECLLILLLCPLFIVCACAEELPERIGEMSGAYQAQAALPESVREISGDLRLDGSYDTDGALKRLCMRFIDQMKDQFTESLRTAAEIFLLALLCAVSESLCQSGAMRETIDRIGCCAVSVLVSGSLTDLLVQATDTITRLVSYSHTILPALFTTAAAGGAVLSASTRYAAACLSMDVLITLSQNLILPLIYMFFALSISQSLYENTILQAVLNAVKWCAATAMTVLTMGFGAYLSLTGLISGSGDALTVKTARTVLSRSLPVVGGLLADSASVLLAAAAVVKNTIGASAMISVCALCLSPVVAFSLRLLLYKATAAAVSFLPDARLPKLVGAMGSVFGMLLGLIGCCAAILFMAIVSGIKVLNPL